MARLLLPVLWCSMLMMLGCKADQAAWQLAGSPASPASSSTTSPVRKASPTLPQTAMKAPAKPAVGSQAAAKASPPSVCPDLDPAAYEAAERPTALAPKGILDPPAVKDWVERLEGQVKDVQGHLRGVIASHAACRSPTDVAATSAP